MPVRKMFQYVYVYCIVLNIYIWGIVYDEDYVPPFYNPFLMIECYVLLFK